jgi:7,8-dihydropterin-6-yl-methyl-4-(beta-D-ribofuranosyl)aminobenzene 5'-phosphate synthase
MYDAEPNNGRSTMKLAILSFCVVSSFVLSRAASLAQELSSDEVVAKLSKLRQEDPTYAMLFDRSGDPGELYSAFIEGTEKARDDWLRRQSELTKLADFGSTKNLVILPLVDWNVAHDRLAGESGVAYLVKTDNATVLFDVGLNAEAEDPSPLLRNMGQLGVDVRQIDAIVISHPHGDHAGGGKWVRKDSFSLTDQQIDLGDIKAYTPVPMQYPGIEVTFTENPTVIAPGVATTGVITNHFFFMGETPEQGLAVNVDGQGIVVIVGCGHQTLKKIVDRAEALFDAPLSGVLGGLHYPVTKGRNIDIHRYVGTGKLPGEFLTVEDVQENADYLKMREIAVVGLSPHDSCDTSIEIFRRSFPHAYREILVGQEIVIPPRDSMPTVTAREREIQEDSL